jgi:putative ABC transport system ATP-binding protein
MSAAPIELGDVSYYYGRGSLRKQILFGVDVSVSRGEIVILTGPSGSGKTTLLTLIGALRSAQEGSVRVLDRELNRASERQRVQVRRQIGYIFQSHNLLRSLTIRQNVQMAQRLGKSRGRQARKELAEVLERVGLGEHANKYPTQLSGGQRQRAGIARALVNRPQIVLADEPTASLDKKSGRDVVELIEELAREDGAAVVLVTHDNRILDVADRVLHLEDGHMKSATEAVAQDTSRLLNLLQREGAGSRLASFSLALARVAYADSVVDERERTAIRQILMDKAELTPGEVDFIMEMSNLVKPQQQHDVLPHPSPADETARKRAVIDALFDVANADGKILDEEVAEIRAIAAEFGIPDHLVDRRG